MNAISIAPLDDERDLLTSTRLEHLHEGLLGNGDFADLLHALFALFLFVDEITLAGGGASKRDVYGTRLSA